MTNNTENIVLNENILPNDYPVHADLIYVVDGKLIRSDVFGTVADLKRDLRKHYKLEAIEVKNCDVENRKKILNSKK